MVLSAHVNFTRVKLFKAWLTKAVESVMLTGAKAQCELVEANW